MRKKQSGTWLEWNVKCCSTCSLSVTPPHFCTCVFLRSHNDQASSVGRDGTEKFCIDLSIINIGMGTCMYVCVYVCMGSEVGYL